MKNFKIHDAKKFMKNYEDLRLWYVELLLFIVFGKHNYQWHTMLVIHYHLGGKIIVALLDNTYP
jgi:hypothetical protein